MSSASIATARDTAGEAPLGRGRASDRQIAIPARSTNAVDAMPTHLLDLVCIGAFLK
jgi:hypothetical protein